MRTTEVEAGCFSETQLSQHLHPVDIYRVYSRLCNCLLPAVLHYQPWKWNLINPDRLLIYKTNWQSIKRGVTFQIRCRIHTFFTESTHTHTHKTTATISILQQIFFPLKQEETRSSWAKSMYVDNSVSGNECCYNSVMEKLKLHHSGRKQMCYKFKGQLFWQKSGSQCDRLYMDGWSVGNGIFFFSLQVRQGVDIQNVQTWSSNFKSQASNSCIHVYPVKTGPISWTVNEENMLSPSHICQHLQHP